MVACGFGLLCCVVIVWLDVFGVFKLLGAFDSWLCLCVGLILCYGVYLRFLCCFAV